MFCLFKKVGMSENLTTIILMIMVASYFSRFTIHLKASKYRHIISLSLLPVSSSENHSIWLLSFSLLDTSKKRVELDLQSIRSSPAQVMGSGWLCRINLVGARALD